MNDERGNGGNETVTDCQQCVSLSCVHPLHVFLDDTDKKSADNIDAGNHKAGFNVTGNKFPCTVHGSVEVRFTTHMLTLPCRFFFIDQACIQISFNCHLLTGHGVEGKAGSDFCDTCRTLNDDSFVQDIQDHEDDDANDIVTTDNEFAKTLND